MRSAGAGILPSPVPFVRRRVLSSVPLRRSHILRTTTAVAIGVLAAEAAHGQAVAAIANAVANATGKRIRDLPFTPARIKASSVSGEDEAGPRVATILVWRDMQSPKRKTGSKKHKSGGALSAPPLTRLESWGVTGGACRP